MPRDPAELDRLVVGLLLAAGLAVVAVGAATVGLVLGGFAGALVLAVPVGCGVLAGFHLGLWPAVGFACLTGLVGPSVVGGLVDRSSLPAVEAGLVWWVVLPVMLVFAGVGLLARAAWRAWADRRALVVAGMIVAVVTMAGLSAGALLAPEPEERTALEERTTSGVGQAGEREECRGGSAAQIEHRLEDEELPTTARAAAEEVAGAPIMATLGAGTDLKVGPSEPLGGGSEEFAIRRPEGQLVALVLVEPTEVGTYAATRLTVCR